MATYSHYQPTPFDDCITPSFVWEDIKDYIPSDKEIWCPFYFNGDHKLRDLGFKEALDSSDFKGQFNKRPMG